MKPLKWYRSLATTKGRRESGCFLIEGIRAVEQVFRADTGAVEELLLSETAELPRMSQPVPVRTLSPDQLSSIAVSVHPQGIIACVRIPEGSSSGDLPEEPGNSILLLDNVQDPGNVGTLVRCAAAFDCCGVLLTNGCADPYGPKAVQASAGALLRPWVRRSPDTLTMIDTLRQRGYRLLCADVHGGTSVDFSSGDRTIIALGNEGTGFSEAVKARADASFSIPMNTSAVESINVAMSGAISLFSLFRGVCWE